jgi:hypothetical protein
MESPGNLFQKYVWILPIILASIMYIPILQAPLFDYADPGNTILNPWTRLPFLSAVQEIFSDFKPKFTYQPWVYLSFWIEYRISNGSAWVFHLISLVWHLLNIGLLGLLLRRLAITSPFLWFALCIPAIHPLGMETISWVSNRAILMCTAFMLLSAHLWLMQGGRYRIWALVAAFMASMTHPIAMSLSPILLLLEANKVWGSELTLPKWKSIIPIALITILPFAYILYVRIRWMPKGLSHYNIGEAIGSQLSYWVEMMHVFFKQFIDAEVPVIEYALVSEGTHLGYLVVAIAIILISVFTILQIRQQKFRMLPVMGMLVFASVFLIQLHVYPYDAPMLSDRYFYLPLFVLGLVFLTLGEMFTLSSKYFGFLHVLLFGFVCAWTYQVYQQLPAWQSSTAVWEASIHHQPAAKRGYHSIYAIQDEDVAVDTSMYNYMKQGLQYYPDDFFLHHIVGRYWFGIGEYDSAKWYFTNTILLESGHARSYAYMARIAWLQQDSAKYASHRRLAEFHGYKGVLEPQFIERMYGK